MPVTVQSYITSSVPAFFAPGRYAHRISTDDGVTYNTRRVNCAKYRVSRKSGGPFASIALAKAWCDTDLGIVRPDQAVAVPTTTTAGFTQPAVGATVSVACASVVGYAVDMSVYIATAGTYQITAIAAPNMTLKNLGYVDNAPPTTVIATGKTVTAVAGPG